MESENINVLFGTRALHSLGKKGLEELKRLLPSADIYVMSSHTTEDARREVEGFDIPAENVFGRGAWHETAETPEKEQAERLEELAKRGFVMVDMDEPSAWLKASRFVKNFQKEHIVVYGADLAGRISEKIEVQRTRQAGQAGNPVVGPGEHHPGGENRDSGPGQATGK